MSLFAKVFCLLQVAIVVCLSNLLVYLFVLFLFYLIVCAFFVVCTMLLCQERTLLVLRTGNSDETPYHKAHLRVKPGFWCMHQNEVKFLVTSRFICSKKINVVDALSYPDSPVILRKEFSMAMSQTVCSLRKLNGLLTNAESNIPGRAHLYVTGTF